LLIYKKIVYNIIQPGLIGRLRFARIKVPLTYYLDIKLLSTSVIFFTKMYIDNKLVNDFMDNIIIAIFVKLSLQVISF